MICVCPDKDCMSLNTIETLRADILDGGRTRTRTAWLCRVCGNQWVVEVWNDKNPGVPKVREREGAVEGRGLRVPLV